MEQLSYLNSRGILQETKRRKKERNDQSAKKLQQGLYSRLRVVRRIELIEVQLELTKSVEPVAAECGEEDYSKQQ